MTEKDKKKAFSRIGWYLVVLLITSTVTQSIVIAIISKVYKPVLDYGFVNFIIIFGSMYLVGVPVANMLLKGKSVLVNEKKNLDKKTLLKLIPITVLVVYLGSILGQVVINLLTAVTGKVAVDPVGEILSQTNIFFTFIFVGLIGPIVEEYVFRKQILDHTRMFGDKRAIVFSAFVFALFHGNLSQMFYAFTLGLLFGYIYVKTGSIKYSAGLHVMVNTVSGVIVGRIANSLDLEVLNKGFGVVFSSGEFGKFIIVIIYSFLVLVLAVIGAFLFLKNRNRINFEPPVLELERPFKQMYINGGVIVFTLFMLISIIGSFI